MRKFWLLCLVELFILSGFGVASCGDDADTDTDKCGNGVIDPGEECDGADGCADDCTLLCGNGVIEPSEECDGGDNCTDDCEYIWPGAVVTIDGEVTVVEGSLSGLTPVGTPIEGSLEFNAEGDLIAVLVIVGSFCFSDKASGDLPDAEECPAGIKTIPIFREGQTKYDPAGQPTGSVFQQAGSTFYGQDASGLLNLSSFSPSFGFFLSITITFVEDGTGLLTEDSDLGTLKADLDWTTAAPSS